MFSISNNNNTNSNILEIINLSELKIRVEAEIIECTDQYLRTKLYEMGLVPGEIIIIEKTAPLGDPIQINHINNIVIIRKKDLNNILVKKV
jgi:ferrous iron transport protein A